MSYAGVTPGKNDDGGRRSGTDRRYYSYSGYIPEHHYGRDRPKLEDRRHYVKVDESIPNQQDAERRKVLTH